MADTLLRKIPKVDELLRLPELAALGVTGRTLTEAIRTVLAELRLAAKAGSLACIPTTEELCARIAARVAARQQPSLRPVLNATGVVLHTNLGRACLAPEAAKAAFAVAESYSTLEYNLESGGRGLRYMHVEELLREVTGAEAALVVNNNAAAVLLILSALAKGGEVVTSRGELVEIGGSFRVPEIMESSGCRLREVGTTNKTRLADYAAAIGEETRALLKVHTSNFKILGFTESVSPAELVALGRERGLPVIEDIGSGSLVDLEAFGIHDEPTVQESIRAGVDVVCFSGDKLLGGPQAGIIIGKKEPIARLCHHPLTRALRVDKMTLAALEATLRLYAGGAAESRVPTLAMLAAKPEALEKKANALCAALAAGGVSCAVIPEEDQVGGGAVPTQMLPTFVVAIAPQKQSVDELDCALRHGEMPVVGRIAHNRYLLDVRTLCEEDFERLVRAVCAALS